MKNIRNKFDAVTASARQHRWGFEINNTPNRYGGFDLPEATDQRESLFSVMREAESLIMHYWQCGGDFRYTFYLDGEPFMAHPFGARNLRADFQCGQREWRVSEDK